MMNRKARLQQNSSRRGAHRNETGIQAIDRRAKAEGDAIRVLALARPHVPHVGKSILWNTSPIRSWYRQADEQATQCKRLRRYMAGFFCGLNLGPNQDRKSVV
jgi:hypothetical protein